MTIPKMPFSFMQFVKHPLFAVGFLCVFYISYKELTRKGDVESANAKADYWQAKYEESRRENVIIYRELLEKNGIINAVKERVDSSTVNINTLVEKASNSLENINKRLNRK